MMVFSLVMFYIALIVNYKYYKDSVTATTAEKTVNTVGIVVSCSVIIVSNVEFFPFLIGAPVIVVSSFGVFAHRQTTSWDMEMEN